VHCIKCAERGAVKEKSLWYCPIGILSYFIRQAFLKGHHGSINPEKAFKTCPGFGSSVVSLVAKCVKRFI